MKHEPHFSFRILTSIGLIPRKSQGGVKFAQGTLTSLNFAFIASYKDIICRNIVLSASDAIIFLAMAHAANPVSHW